MDTFEAVGRQAYPAQDLSVEQWLHEGGASNRMIDIADACFANDFGCSISQLGMRETILENRSWDAGRLVLQTTWTSLVGESSLVPATIFPATCLQGRLIWCWTGHYQGWSSTSGDQPVPTLCWTGLSPGLSTAVVGLC